MADNDFDGEELRPPEELPTEILAHICSYLALPAPAVLGRERWEHIKLADDARTSSPAAIKLRTNNEEYVLRLKSLANLAIASKRVEQVATPILYLHYPGQSVSSLALFVRTLWEQPLKRALVREVTLDPWHLQEAAQRQVPRSFGPDSAFAGELHRYAANGNVDAMVTLLLILCHRIEDLDITTPSWRRSILATIIQALRFRRMAADSLCSAGGVQQGEPELFLHRLQSLSVRTPDAEHSILSQHYGDFLQWPTVTRITLFRSQVDAVLFQMPWIEELVLWRCIIFEGFFEIAVQHMPSLRRLACSWSGVSVQSWYDDRNCDLLEVRYEKVHDALRRHCPKLEILRVDNRELIAYDKNLFSLNDIDLTEHLTLRVVAFEAESLFGTHALRRYDSTRQANEYRPLVDQMPPYLEKLVVLVIQRPSASAADDLGDEEHEDPECNTAGTEEDPTASDRRIRTVLHCSERNDFVIVRECCTYALAAPETLKAIHIDLTWSNILVAEARQHLGEDSGWAVVAVLNDEEIMRPSPVLDWSVELEDRAKIYDHWKQWDPDGDGSTSIVLRRM